MKYFLALILAFLVGVPLVSAQVETPNYNPRVVGAPLEVHIYDNGSVLVHGARVEQVAGSTIYTKVYWGLAFLRLTVRTSEKTQFLKKSGSEMKMSEIKVGDFVTIEGDFFSGNTSLDVNAKKIKNWSAQSEFTELKGDVVGFSNTPGGFSMQTRDGLVSVYPLPDAPIKRGSLTVTLDKVRVGDKIDSAIGTYDGLAKKLTATHITVYQNMKIFAPKLYAGELVSIANDGNSLVIFSKTENKNYTIRMGTKTTLHNNARKVVALKRFAPGDWIRVWGSLREDDYTAVDAEVVRNTDL